MRNTAGDRSTLARCTGVCPMQAVRAGQKALCKQMASLMMRQWDANRHICENYVGPLCDMCVRVCVCCGGGGGSGGEVVKCATVCVRVLRPVSGV